MTAVMDFAEPPLQAEIMIKSSMTLSLRISLLPLLLDFRSKFELRRTIKRHAWHERNQDNVQVIVQVLRGEIISLMFEGARVCNRERYSLGS